jgi:ABC-type phosphate/phosphonate transport system substrate-binding protein
MYRSRNNRIFCGFIGTECAFFTVWKLAAWQRDPYFVEVQMNVSTRTITAGISRLSRISAMALALWITMLGAAQAVPAADRGLVLAVQPVLSEAQTKKAFEPLARYLSRATGEPVTVKTWPNFMAYWSDMLHDPQNTLYFDAAHFTAYRASKFHDHVLAKVPATVSYSLIVRDDKIVFDPSELTGKTVATLGAPSIGAARLNGMFPNPSRQPIMIEVPDSQAGVQMVLDGKVEAAIIPTPIVAQRMGQGAHISVVTTTEPIPHIALSASAGVSPKAQKEIRQAMVDAINRPDGQLMLKKIGFPKFDPASASVYKGQQNILKTYWGF